MMTVFNSSSSIQERVRMPSADAALGWQVQIPTSCLLALLLTSARSTDVLVNPYRENGPSFARSILSQLEV